MVKGLDSSKVSSTTLRAASLSFELSLGSVFEDEVF